MKIEEIEPIDDVDGQLKLLAVSHLRDPINPEGKVISGVAAKDNETFLEYKFDDAEAFLAAFDVQSELYESIYSNQTRTFLFRGHADHSWALLPSVFRYPVAKENAEEHSRHLKAHGAGATIAYELEPFTNFLEQVNALGILLEEASLGLMELYRLRRSHHNIDTYRFAEFIVYESSFPTKAQMRALALAQHYGVSTRLLDWTRNPYKSLFFAVSSATFKAETANEDRIGIWVLPRLLIEAARIVSSVDLVEVPAFQNRNIAAQEGVFVNYVPSLNEHTAGNRNFPTYSDEDGYCHLHSLDRILMELSDKKLYQALIDQVIGKPMLFTLPYGELGLVVKKLKQLNISWTTMMPSLEGAAKEACSDNQFPV